MVLRQAATARQEVVAVLALLAETAETLLAETAGRVLHRALLVLPCNEQAGAVLMQTLLAERHQVAAARVPMDQLLALQTLEAAGMARAQAALGLLFFAILAHSAVLVAR